LLRFGLCAFAPWRFWRSGSTDCDAAPWINARNALPSASAAFFSRLDMSYEPTWKERWEDARRWAGPALAVLIVAVVLAWTAWHQRRVAAVGRSDTAAGQAALMQNEADVLEHNYERALEAGVAETEIEQLLNRAIQKQRDALKLQPEPTPAMAARVARLEAARGTLHGRAALARAKLREEEAAQAEANGRRAEAQDRRREALRLLREANAQLAGTDVVDVARETRLATTIAATDAEPWHTAVEVARTLALAATAREQWSDALKAYADARTAQAELNERFPGTRFADPAALAHFDAEIATINATALATAATAREREAEAAAAAGQSADAGAAFESAIALQREINAKFPRSRHASAAKLDALAARRDTLLSATELARATALNREIDLLLQGRQAARARDKIVEAAKIVAQSVTDFPHSRTNDPQLRQKLAYLATRGSDLPGMHDYVYARLLRAPVSGAAQMLSVEVTQELYGRVMDSNPSRHVGAKLPVDSVTWHEAHEFCQRLGWILGGRARLPTEAEFRAAFGRDTQSGAAELATGAWSAANSEDRTHEAGTSPRTPAGFFDLAGNVGEWLEPVRGAGDTAPVAGGSYLDPAATLRAVPIVATAKDQRAPHIGFRVVVVWPTD
jgi:hypothetical protein